MFSSRRLPLFEFLARILEFFSVFLEFFQISLSFFYRFCWFFMLFLRFFLPAALVSNHWGFWKSRNIPIFTIYGYNVSQSMCSGHILSTYYVYFWVRILKSWPCVKFLLISRKAAPDLSFWTKKVLSFCPKGKNWVFWHLSFCKNLQCLPELEYFPWAGLILHPREDIRGCDH